MDDQIVLSPRALASLAEITAHIAKDNPDRAESFGNKLLDWTAALAAFPNMGSVTARNPRWRKLLLKPYIITYRVDPHRKRAILAFRHTSRHSP